MRSHLLGQVVSQNWGRSCPRRRDRWIEEHFPCIDYQRCLDSLWNDQMPLSKVARRASNCLKSLHRCHLRRLRRFRGRWRSLCLVGGAGSLCAFCRAANFIRLISLSLHAVECLGLEGRRWFHLFARYRERLSESRAGNFC